MPKLSSAAEAKLLTAAALGDPKAAGQLLLDCKGLVYLAALAETKDPRVAGEACREVASDIGGIAARKTKRHTALAYLLREARRIARDIATRGSYHIDAPAAEALIKAAAEAEGPDGGFDETTWNLLILTGYLELTPKKAAAVLAIPGSTAGFRLRTAKTALDGADFGHLLENAAAEAPEVPLPHVPEEKRYAPKTEFRQWFPIACGVTVCVLSAAASVVLGILGVR